MMKCQKWRCLPLEKQNFTLSHRRTDWCTKSMFTLYLSKWILFNLQESAVMHHTECTKNGPIVSKRSIDHCMQSDSWVRALTVHIGENYLFLIFIDRSRQICRYLKDSGRFLQIFEECGRFNSPWVWVLVWKCEILIWRSGRSYTQHRKFVSLNIASSSKIYQKFSVGEC
jgi:hypothetical protein